MRFPDLGFVTAFLFSHFLSFTQDEDGKGDIWCSTSNGLFKYDKETDSFSNFTDESAIITPSLLIYRITEDHEGNLWLSSPGKGIIRLNKERTSAVLYGKNQGVNGLGLRSFGYTMQNGDVLFGDTSGYFDFKPNLLQQNVLPPFVTISNFLLNNVPVQPSAHGILTMPLVQTKKITFKSCSKYFFI